MLSIALSRTLQSQNALHSLLNYIEEYSLNGPNVSCCDFFPADEGSKLEGGAGDEA